MLQTLESEVGEMRIAALPGQVVREGQPDIGESEDAAWKVCLILSLTRVPSPVSPKP